MIYRSCLFALLLPACSVHAEAPAQKRGAEPPATEPAKPSVQSRPASSTAAVPSQAQLTAARTALVDRFVAHDTLALSPDAAAARFADVYAMRRERESVDSFALAGGTSTEMLEFTFLPDGKNGFYCSSAILRFKLPSAAQSAALKQAIQQHLRTKLGKPKGYGSANSPFWKLVRRIEVSLSEFGAELAGPGSSAGERIVELSISEPSGP